MPLIAGLLVLTIANRVRGGLAEARAQDIAAAAPITLTAPQPRCVRSKNGSFRTADGTELFYRFWPAQSATPQGAVVLFHRGHEHGGRMAHLADELDLPDFAIFAWDARGHGRSRGEVGNSASLATSVRDVQDFVDHIAATYEIATEDIAIVAQSVGAVLVAAWAHDYAPRIRCLVLASPAFKVKLYVPFARSLLKLRYALFGHFFVNSYVKARFLTHDPERVASYEADPLITRPIAVNILLQLYEAGARIVADARAIVVPTQLLISGADWVVDTDCAAPLLRAAGHPDQGAPRAARLLPRHAWASRTGRLAIGKARAFILARFAEAPETVSLLDADRMSYTRDEADALASPLSPWSWRALYWAATAVGDAGRRDAVLRYRTRPQDRLRLRFDPRLRLSQPTARGRGALGRLIDKAYLESIGWRGIRQRKLHVEELVCTAMQHLPIAACRCTSSTSPPVTAAMCSRRSPAAP